MFKVVIPQQMEAILLPLYTALDCGSAAGLLRPDVILSSCQQGHITVESADDVWHITHQVSPNLCQIYRPGCADGYEIRVSDHGVAGDIAEVWKFEGENIAFISNHCFDFSSAQTMDGYIGWLIAAICFEFSLADSLALAHLGRDVSRETWLHSATDLLTPQLPQQLSPVDRFMPVDLANFNLYPVVDNINQLAELLRLGVKTVQLRIKQVDHATESSIKTAIELGNRYQAQVFINDHWQLAIKHGAYGIHLGQEDIRYADLSEIRRLGIRLGISTHGYHEMRLAAKLKPSYIALGHIFPTTTKQMESRPQGLIRLKLYQNFIDSFPDELPIPSCAIGGINLDNAKNVLACGVHSIAVVRAITQAEDMTAAVKQLTSLFHSESAHE